MKLKVFILLLFSFVFTEAKSQNDSIVYKNGKVVVGNFQISNGKDYILQKNKNTLIPVQDMEYFSSRGTVFIPVMYGNDEMNGIFLAEQIVKSEIGLLELEITIVSYNIKIIQYYLYRNKKASRVSEKNMAAFYKTYFNDCAAFQNKINNDYNYTSNGIIEVINTYKNCINSKNVAIKEIKHIVSNSLTLSANTAFTRHYLADGAHSSGVYYPNNDDANIKGTCLGFAVGLQTRFAKKIVTDLTLSYQYNKAFTPNTYLTNPTGKTNIYNPYGYEQDTVKLNYSFNGLFLSVASAKYKTVGKGILSYGMGLKFGAFNNIKNTFPQDKNYRTIPSTGLKKYYNWGGFIKVDYNYPIAENLEIFGRVQFGYSIGTIDYFQGKILNNILGLENIAVGICFPL